jgi:hypothetical protein
MNSPFIDTDVIVRLITGDDPAKQSATALFQAIEDGGSTVATPEPAARRSWRHPHTSAGTSPRGVWTPRTASIAGSSGLASS